MMRKINHKTPRLFTSYLVLSFLLLQGYVLIPEDKNILLASDETGCSEKLDQAEEHYYDGEFDQTIKIVNECLAIQNLPNEEQIRAYTILSRTYLAKEEIVRTKDNIRIILRLDPTYQPTIEQETPRYVTLVEEVKKEEKPVAVTEVESGISKWWYIGAGGVAAIAIIAVVASGSGGDDNPDTSPSLPNPPDFPE